MGQFGAQSSWNTNIWGDNLADQQIADTALEGKAGSSSLLSSSESDGWNGRSNAFWGHVKTPSAALSRAPNTGMATSPIQTRASERSAAALPETSDSSYFPLPRASGIGTTANHTSFLHSGPESFPVAGEGLPVGPIGGSRVTDGRRHAGTTTFGGSHVGTGFPMRSGLSSPLDSARADDIGVTSAMAMSSIPQTLPDSASQTLNRNAYAHSSHNSTSFTAQRPAHSSYPSFHSESQGFEGRYGNNPVDINAGLSKLQVAEGGFGPHSGSKRPTYLSHPSLDSSLQRLRYQGPSDEGNYQNVTTYTNDSAPDLPVGYPATRSRVGDGPISPTEYPRMESPFHQTLDGGQLSGPHFRNTSGSRLSDNQAVAFDRRLRGIATEHDTSQQSSNPLRLPPFQPAYEVSRYQAAGLNNIPGFYPVAHLGAAALVSRGHRDHDPSQTVRSHVLEEFRANSKGNKRYELKDIYNYIVEFSGDQHGSRFIQQKLETANSDEKEQVFREIQGDSLQLMTDVFGNYVVQKLFEHGNQTQKKILANQMKGHILTLSLQMYGCRVVQKALEHILTDQQASMVKELENHVLRCVRDQNGNHVIQKAIERVPSEHVQFIINSFIGQVEKLATHPYGCRVIQRMLEHCKEEDRQAILSELHTATSRLIPDQFGNYVIQHVIENGEESDRSRMIAKVMKELIMFSRHKFASNVVEKSIDFGERSQRRQIITMLTTPDEKGEDHLAELIRDQYGNYVIQKILGQLKGAERESLVEEIKPALCHMKKYSYGKQIVAIEKLVYDSNIPSSGPLTAHTSSSTTPPNSHKSSPQPSKRSVSAVESARAPVVGAAPPTPPPTDSQANADGSVETKSADKSTVTPLAESESADATPTAPVKINGTA
ncbi:hypothetical protein EYZ11_008534 [Aspergillus tanneri]|nr:hypothetical protein EYZ11_008534 [Aspergillus tanneri]